MKTLKFTSLIFTLCLNLLFSNQLYAKADSGKIQKLFKSYKSLVVRGNPEVVDMVSQETLDYFEQILFSVKYATKEEVLKSNLLDHANIVLYRHVLSKETLAELDGKALFRLSVKRGFSGEKNYQRMDIGNVVVNGSTAVADMTFDGRGVPNRFYFKKEGNDWKVNLIEMILESQQFLEFEHKKNNVTQSKFILAYVEFITNTKVDDSIYIAPFKR